MKRTDTPPEPTAQSANRYHNHIRPLHLVCVIAGTRQRSKTELFPGVSYFGAFSFPILAVFRFLFWLCFISYFGRISFPILAEYYGRRACFILVV